MLVYGVEEFAEIQALADRHAMAPKDAKRKGTAWQFSLVPVLPFSQRTGMAPIMARSNARAGRKGAACWFCHKLFFDSLFERFPMAIVVTGGGGKAERYEGRESYRQKVEAQWGNLPILHASCSC